MQFVVIEVDEANLTWVYIVGAVAGVLIILCIIFVIWRVKTQSKITQDVKEERTKGIHKSWGDRSRSSILLIKQAQKQAD